jgi:hypothetical protein
MAQRADAAATATGNGSVAQVPEATEAEAPKRGLDDHRVTAARSGRSSGETLPNLVVIGAQKCGTTALHSYLVRHPQISMSRPKELNFFIEELNWRRGVDWYRGQFDPGARVRGESSPDYTADPWYAGVPERMHSVVPDAKLIFIVRDPVERVRAQWIHNYSNRAQDKPLHEAVLEEGSTYIPRSSYHYQLSRFLEHYPMSQILVLDQSELLEKRRQTLPWIFRFLGVDDGFWNRSFRKLALESADRRRKTPLGVWSSEHLPGRYWRRLRHRAPFSFPFEHTQMSDELRAEVAERLADDVARFRALTGRRFQSWSI